MSCTGVLPTASRDLAPWLAAIREVGVGQLLQDAGGVPTGFSLLEVLTAELAWELDWTHCYGARTVCA